MNKSANIILLKWHLISKIKKWHVGVVYLDYIYFSLCVSLSLHAAHIYTHTSFLFPALGITECTPHSCAEEKLI